MIRQAISCDVCGRDKHQTKHWFVAYEHGAELRVSGWSAQARIGAKAKHLCGQTCVHKLVDEYMARTLTAGVASQADENIAMGERPILAPMRADAVRADAARATASPASAVVPASSARLSAPAVISIDEYESSARLIEPSLVSAKEALQPVAVAQQKIEEKLEPTVRVIMPILERHDDKVVPSRPGYNPRTWRADAWKREQERERGARTGSRRRSLL